MNDGDAIAGEFKRAMRRLASTVTIVGTADANGNRYGTTATAVDSVSMNPPSLLVCINHAASIHAPLSGRGAFCVNVLTTEHERLVSAFSGRLTGEERFAVGDWRDDGRGHPVPRRRAVQPGLRRGDGRAVRHAFHRRRARGDHLRRPAACSPDPAAQAERPEAPGQGGQR